MRKLLLVLLVLVLAAAVAAEVIAPRLVEARIEERVEANTQGRASVDADVQSFPFLPTLATQGRIRRLTVTLDEVMGQQVPVTVRFGLEGIQLDRQVLLRRRQVRVVDVDRGRLTVEVGGQGLPSGLLGRLGSNLAGNFLPCTPEREPAEGKISLTCQFQGVPRILAAGG